jgi:hypothetical protein
MLLAGKSRLFQQRFQLPTDFISRSIGLARQEKIRQMAAEADF